MINFIVEFIKCNYEELAALREKYCNQVENWSIYPDWLTWCQAVLSRLLSIGLLYIGDSWIGLQWNSIVNLVKIWNCLQVSSALGRMICIAYRIVWLVLYWVSIENYAQMFGIMVRLVVMHLLRLLRNFYSADYIDVCVSCDPCMVWLLIGRRLLIIISANFGIIIDGICEDFNCWPELCDYFGYFGWSDRGAEYWGDENCNVLIWNQVLLVNPSYWRCNRLSIVDLKLNPFIRMNRIAFEWCCSGLLSVYWLSWLHKR